MLSVLLAVLAAALVLASAAASSTSAVIASTYLGGPGYDNAWTSAVDRSGNTYIAGDTQAAGFPVTVHAWQKSFGGGGQDGFVAKFDKNGKLLWSTLLGGSGWDGVYGMSVDASCEPVVTGVTESTNFPVTATAVQRALAGGADAFVTVLSPDGTAVRYSTYLGGRVSDGAPLPINPYHFFPASDDADLGIAVATGPSGAVYIAGETNSIDLPASGSAQPLIGGSFDCFVARIDTVSGRLSYLTYLGGASYDFCSGVAVDSAGEAFVTGEAQSLNFPVTPGAFQSVHSPGTAAFVTKLSADGTRLAYSTLLGGSKGGSASSGSNYTAGSAIAIDAAGDAFVDGTTNDTDFPTTPGVVQPANRGIDDGFVTELAPGGSSLVFSTYLGASDYEGLFGLALDPYGNVFVDGFSSSRDLPQVKPFQSRFGGFTDAWLAELSSGGRTLLRSSYLGGSDQDFAYGLALSNGRISIAGVTPSHDFPVTLHAPQPVYGGGVGDAFLTIVR